jgi:hypothetical protein
MCTKIKSAVHRDENIQPLVQHRVSSIEYLQMSATCIIMFLLVLVGFLLLLVMLRSTYSKRDYRSRDYWKTRLQDHQNKILAIAEIVHQVFVRHGICYWMHNGTLLGAIRHHNIIPWDDDMDLVVVESNTTEFRDNWKAAAHELVSKHGLALVEMDYGWQLRQSRFSLGCIDLWMFHIERNNIDNEIRFASRIGTRGITLNYHCARLTFPLVLYSFDRLQLYGPQDPWEFLSRVYTHKFWCEARFDLPHVLKWSAESYLYVLPHKMRMTITDAEQSFALQFSPAARIRTQIQKIETSLFGDK